MNRKVTVRLSNYRKATPFKWQVVGDVLLAISAAGTVSGAIMDIEWVAISFSVAGFLGKVITSLAAHDY